MCECCLHPRHAVLWCFAQRTVAGRRARDITGSHSQSCFLLHPPGMSVRWDSMSFFPWRARTCLATFLHWGGYKDISIFVFCNTTIPGQSLRGILTTFSSTSKCLRWPLVVESSLNPWCCRCSLTRRNQSFQRKESTPAGITKLSWTWSESTRENINLCWFFWADYAYRRDARVDDDEECCHFGVLPSFPSTWEVLQETCAWKEKGNLFFDNLLEIVAKRFFSSPNLARSVSSKLSSIWCTINDL